MILAEVSKFVGAKVAGAIITVAVIAGGIWCWQNPEAVKAFGAFVKYLLIWLVVAAALPWSSYLFMRPLLNFQHNMQSVQAALMASLAVIGGFTALDILLAFYLAGGLFTGGFTWLVVILGFAAAAAYNYVICESLARHVDG